MDIPFALLNMWFIALVAMGLSYLFRPNPFFTAVMQMIVGVLAANFMILAVHTFINSTWTPLMEGNILKLVYIVIGALFLTTFIDRWRWLSRYPTAILTGAGLGMVMRNILWTDVLSQIQGTMIGFTGNLVTDFGNVWFVVVLFISLFYFMFGVPHKGPMATAGKFARAVMMAGIGAQAGNRFYTEACMLFVKQTILVKYWWDDLIVALTG